MTRLLILALVAASSALPDDGGVRVDSERGPDPNTVQGARSKIDWKPSIATGETNDGHLLNGVRLPAEGRDFFTWDPILLGSPNRPWRRWGTDRLLRVVLRIAREYREDNPGAPRLAIGDISRPFGGEFGKRFGGVGHASHQNGLDIDVYYPRLDRLERAPRTVGQVDMRLSQDLVNRFVAVGAQYVFVGPSTTLHGPRKVVQKLTLHDNHLHARLYNPLPPWMRPAL